AGFIPAVFKTYKDRRDKPSGSLRLAALIVPYLIVTFISRFLTRNAHWSAASSMIFAVGRPAPWPARVSIRASTGAGPDWQYCSWAMNLKLWLGTTRSSVSAVVTSVAGYAVPGFRLWYGEILYSALNSSGSSELP